MIAVLEPSPLWGEGRVRGTVSETPRQYARHLRHEQTDAERKLWARLRDRRLEGTKFRRQHPLGPFIVEFCRPETKLVIELDGGQHASQREDDALRTAFLHSEGYRVLRFWNNDVLVNIDGVLHRIVDALRDPHPAPLPGRERESKDSQKNPRPSGERAG